MASKFNQSGLRVGNLVANNVVTPSISRLFNLINKIIISGPGNTYNINPIFINNLVTILTPIITANVINNLCEQGCIDPYCCGNNNIGDLNRNLKNFLNSSNINDNDFSLLSTEIFEDITSEINEQPQSDLIQSIDSIESSESTESIEANKLNKLFSANENENENENKNKN